MADSERIEYGGFMIQLGSMPSLSKDDIEALATQWAEEDKVSPPSYGSDDLTPKMIAMLGSTPEERAEALAKVRDASAKAIEFVQNEQNQR